MFWGSWGENVIFEGRHYWRSLKGGFTKGGGISQGYGGVDFYYGGSPKHVENLGIHWTIIETIIFARGLWYRRYRPASEAFMISEWYEHPDLLDYVNGGMTRTAVSFRRCGVPQKDGAHSKQ